MRIAHWACLLLGFTWLGSVQAEELPKGIKWETNDKAPLIAAPQAKKGGLFRVPISTFPLTLRTVGPDANTVLYTALLANRWSMTTIHPNTKEIIPLLATHWAFGKDGKTMYYKLDPKAQWSDGKPVTPEDFAFTLEFMLSKNIQDPWYNNVYAREFDKVVIFDRHTVAIRLKNPKPDLHLWADLAPTPKHFYKGAVPKNFVQKYNWTVVPNTGPYALDPKQIKKGKSVVFLRKKDWWAKDRPFFKNRYNVDRVMYKVVREQEVMWEQFKKGQLDAFNLHDPKFWHDKTKTEIFEKGYAERLWFYNDKPRGCFGMWLNLQYDLFKDQNVRKAIGHAMNYDRVIKVVQRGEADRLQSCWDGYGDYTSPKLKAPGFDLAKASDLFEKAGWATRDQDGYRINSKKQRLEFDLLYAFDGHTPSLVVLQEEAKKAGVKVNLRYKDWSAMVKQMNDNKHQASYSGFGERDSGIPDFWGIWHGDNAGRPNTNNNANVNDPALNKMIDQYRDSTKKEERQQLAHKIEERVQEIGAFIPATTIPYFRVGYWRWWRLPDVPATNLSSSAFELFDASSGGLFWLDEKLKTETEAAMKSGKAFAPVTKVDKTFRKGGDGKGKKSGA